MPQTTRSLINLICIEFATRFAFFSSELRITGGWGSIFLFYVFFQYMLCCIKVLSDSKLVKNFWRRDNEAIFSVSPSRASSDRLRMHRARSGQFLAYSKCTTLRRVTPSRGMRQSIITVLHIDTTVRTYIQSRTTCALVHLIHTHVLSPATRALIHTHTNIGSWTQTAH